MITVIATVLNEEDNLHRLLRSLVEQTRQPDEVLLVDGGSSDNTVAVIESYANQLPLRVLVEPGSNISTGRNRAIEAAQGEIIAVTDAGVVLEADWLAQITQPLLDDPALQVVSGFFRAEGDSAFEIAMGATVLPLPGEIDPGTFLPSSRSVAFRKMAWQTIGGYPEWLDYCEDLIFDLRLQQTTPPFAFVPEAIVHFRPRSSLPAYFKQYYRYARGDGKADLWRKRHAIRYLTYVFAVPAILLLGLLVHPALWGLYLPGAAVYLYYPYHRLTRILTRPHDLTTLGIIVIVLLIPIIRVLGDIAKMIGYPVGLYWRQRHHPPDWRQIVL